jgi:hypothetical protein
MQIDKVRELPLMMSDFRGDGVVKNQKKLLDIIPLSYYTAFCLNISNITSEKPTSGLANKGQ